MLDKLPQQDPSTKLIPLFDKSAASTCPHGWSVTLRTLLSTTSLTNLALPRRKPRGKEYRYPHCSTQKGPDAKVRAAGGCPREQEHLFRPRTLKPLRRGPSRPSTKPTGNSAWPSKPSASTTSPSSVLTLPSPNAPFPFPRAPSSYPGSPNQCGSIGGKRKKKEKEKLKSPKKYLLRWETAW